MSTFDVKARRKPLMDWFRRHVDTHVYYDSPIRSSIGQLFAAAIIGITLFATDAIPVAAWTVGIAIYMFTVGILLIFQQYRQEKKGDIDRSRETKLHDDFYKWSGRDQ